MIGRITVILIVLGMCVGCATTPAGTAASSQSRAAQGTGNLVVASNAGGAQLTVDGAFWGNVTFQNYQMQHSFKVPVGFHKIEVTCPGYEPYKATIEITEGNMHNLMVILTPAPGDEARRARELSSSMPQQTPVGQFLVEINGPAALYVDGAFYSDVRGEGKYGFKVPVGEHRIRLKYEGCKDYFAVITVTEYNSPTLVVHMEAAPPAVESTGTR